MTQVLMRRYQLTQAPLIILTDPRFDAYVHGLMPQTAPDVDFSVVYDLTALRALLESRSTARLITFVTACIIPADLIGRQSLPDYNIHPGTPDYPGAYPEIRAARDHASTFGATLHELAIKVDSGPIIAVENQPVREHTSEALGLVGFECALTLLGFYAPRIACATSPLPPLGLDWSGRFMTRAQVLALGPR